MIPLNRFNFSEGSLRGAFSSDEAKVVTEGKTNESKISLVRKDHVVLKSLNLATTKGTEKSKTSVSGPLRETKEDLVFHDTSDPNLFWTCPLFELVDPIASEQNIFTAYESGTSISGEPFWSAEVRFGFQPTQLAEVKTRIDEIKASLPEAKFQDIPISVKEANLILPYQTKDGTEEILIQGTIDNDSRQLVFQLSGDAVGLAWTLLKSADAARVEYLYDYSVFEKVAPEEPALDTATSRPQILTQGGSRDTKSLGALTRREPKISFAKRRKRDANFLRSISKTKLANNILKRRAALLAAQKANRAIEAQLPKEVEPTFIKQRVVSKLGQALNFKSAQYAKLFVSRNSETHLEKPISTPPWRSKVGNTIKEYEEVLGSTLKLPIHLLSRLRIYRSLVDAGLFLICPSSYVLATDADTGQPQIRSEIISDPVVPENSALKIVSGLLPEISLADEMRVIAAIENYTSQVETGVAGDQAIRLLYPSEVGFPPKISWGDTLTRAGQPIIDGRAILLSLVADNMGFAKVTLDALSRKNQFLAGQLSFQMPDGDNVVSSVFLDLTRTSGTGVQLSKKSRKVHAQNISAYPLDIDSLVFKSDFGLAQQIEMNPPISLTTQSDHLFDVNWVDGSTFTTETKIRYPDQVEMSSSLIAVDEMVAPVVFTTRFDAQSKINESDLNQIVIEVGFFDQDPITLTIDQDSDTGIFHPIVYNVMVPYSNALNPESCMAKHRAFFHLANGEQKSTDWITQNFFKNPDIPIVFKS